MWRPKVQHVSIQPSCKQPFHTKLYPSYYKPDLTRRWDIPRGKVCVERRFISEACLRKERLGEYLVQHSPSNIHKPGHRVPAFTAPEESHRGRAWPWFTSYRRWSRARLVISGFLLVRMPLCISVLRVLLGRLLTASSRSSLLSTVMISAL